MQITRYDFSADIPKKLRFLVVSDLHDHPYSTVLKHLKAENPDAVLIPGDLFDTLEESVYALDFLRAASALCPVFYAIGNHERLRPGDQEKISAIGATVLNDSDIVFSGLRIGGLTSGFRTKNRFFNASPIPNLMWAKEFTAKPGCKLLLCHHPEYYPLYLKDMPPCFVLSGHAHGGQFRFFGHSFFAPGQGIFPKYTAGVHENRLIISRGASNNTWLPRINNPPEVLLLTFSPER